MPDNLLDDLVFKPDQPENKRDTVIIPLLSIKGITHAISLGPQSYNMAESFNFDSSDLLTRQRLFLEKNGFAPFTESYISGIPGSNEPKLIDITKPNRTGHPIHIPAEGMFTKLMDVPLIHKPADCPTIILYGHDTSGDQVLGLVHLGRPQVNSKVTEQALDHMEKNHSVDLTTTIVGISPSIGPTYYLIKQRDQEEKQFLDLSYWGKYVREDTLQNEAIIRIDVLGKILSILTEYGIPEKNIQAYGHNEKVDTYTLAAKNPPEAFSHRYATGTNQPQKNGRIMVVVQL